jgi:hypothetical protein
MAMRDGQQLAAAPSRHLGRTLGSARVWRWHSGLVTAALIQVACTRGACAQKQAELVEHSQTLALVDCPDGLARCEAGEVFAAQLARVPDGQSCPFAHLGRCATRCVIDDLVVALPQTSALLQLCEGVADEPELLPLSQPAQAAPPVAPGGECDTGEFSCSGTTLYACTDSRWQPRGNCPRGCVPDTAPLHAQELRTANHVLCSRVTALSPRNPDLRTP